MVLKRKKCKLLGPSPELLHQNSRGGAPAIRVCFSCLLTFENCCWSPCLWIVRNAEPQTSTRATWMRIPRSLGCTGKFGKHYSRLSPMDPFWFRTPQRCILSPQLFSSPQKCHHKAVSIRNGSQSIRNGCIKDLSVSGKQFLLLFTTPSVKDASYQFS